MHFSFAQTNQYGVQGRVHKVKFVGKLVDALSNKNMLKMHNFQSIDKFRWGAWSSICCFGEAYLGVSSSCKEIWHLFSVFMNLILLLSSLSSLLCLVPTARCDCQKKDLPRRFAQSLSLERLVFSHSHVHCSQFSHQPPMIPRSIFHEHKLRLVTFKSGSVLVLTVDYVYITSF